jgi:hypothetical protein
VAYVAYASLLHDVVNEGFSVVSMADVHKTMIKCVGLATSTEHPNLRVGVLVALANCNLLALARHRTHHARSPPACVSCVVCRVSCALVLGAQLLVPPSAPKSYVQSLSSLSPALSKKEEGMYAPDLVDKIMSTPFFSHAPHRTHTTHTHIHTHTHAIIARTTAHA